MAHASVSTWSKDRRFKAALEKVLNDGWTQTEAAEHYGVSRQHLNLRLKEARLEHDARLEAAKLATAASSRAVPGKRSTKRTDMPLFRDWWSRYFGSWQCPDCDEHHEMPAFHQEIVDAADSPARRVVINIPPYHSKSTLLTVWWVVYKICEDPSVRIAIISKSEDMAKAFLRQVKQILTDELLYEDADGNLLAEFGPFQPEGKATWNDTEIYVSGRGGAEKDPTVMVLGWGSQIYGRRFDIIIMDDIANVENQTNPDRVAGMMEKIDKEVASRVGKSGKLIWVGTRVRAGDIYSVLQRRPGYKVIRYPLILDDGTETVLWPEHFPYDQAMVHRSEMKPADFQLIYQNVDMPGMGASFTEDLLDECKNTSRVSGQFDSGMRIIGGVDPGGANKKSGYTAFALIAVDLDTGRRFILESYAERQMKSPAVKELILDWSSRYPIYEWRVEANGLQSQIYQYDIDLVQALQKRGVRIEPHFTNHNKWDPQFGVESLAPLFASGMIDIPWGNAPTVQDMAPLIEQLLSFPMGQVSDRVMALWFADLGARNLLNRAHLPLFESRLSEKWPSRIKRRRRIVDFSGREVRPVPLRDQRRGHLSRSQAGYRRMTVGQPTQHGLVIEEMEPEQQLEIVNIDPRIWTP